MSLQRRSARGPACAPAASSWASIETWLLEDGLQDDDLLLQFESLVWRLVAAGLPLDRASLHVGTLHPQMFGVAWNWNRRDGLCDEVRVEAAAVQNDAYRRNPLFRVIQHGETVSGSLADPIFVARFPLMAELARQGLTAYLALPLRAGGAYHNAATVATADPAGFAPADLESLRRVLRLFALHVERHIVRRIGRNVADTYLGPSAGGRVLDGVIGRGSGEAIEAVIWSSDLRGFTDLADRLAGPDMIAVLNAYFEALVGPILAHGGEVLKFIGDGVLAVFPIAGQRSERDAARAAVAAASEAMAALAALNEAPPPALAAIEGWWPLRTGIGLDRGEIFFGNIGAPERLDFTAIGPAVNATARVEAMTKTLQRPLLLTEAVARHLEAPLDDLGEHTLRGFAQPVRLYAPAPTVVSA